MALAVVVLVAAILILRGFALAKEPGRPATVGVGLMAGVLNGSMGIVGPPVILFYFSSPIGVVAGRASIIAYFIGTDSVGTLMFAARGLIDESVWWRTAVFVPILLAGVVAGNRGFVKTDPETFKRVALFVLMALSVLLFARAVWPGVIRAGFRRTGRGADPRIDPAPDGVSRRPGGWPVAGATDFLQAGNSRQARNGPLNRYDQTPGRQGRPRNPIARP